MTQSERNALLNELSFLIKETLAHADYFGGHSVIRNIGTGFNLNAAHDLSHANYRTGIRMREIIELLKEDAK